MPGCTRCPPRAPRRRRARRWRPPARSGRRQPRGGAAARDPARWRPHGPRRSWTPPAPQPAIAGSSGQRGGGIQPREGQQCVRAGLPPMIRRTARHRCGDEALQRGHRRRRVGAPAPERVDRREGDIRLAVARELQDRRAVGRPLAQARRGDCLRADDRARIPHGAADEHRAERRRQRAGASEGHSARLGVAILDRAHRRGAVESARRREREQRQPPDDGVRRTERRRSEQDHARGRERARGPARSRERVEPVREAGCLPDANRARIASSATRAAAESGSGSRPSDCARASATRASRSVASARARTAAASRVPSAAPPRVGLAPTQPPEGLRYRIRRLGADGRDRIGQRRQQPAPQLRPLKAAKPAHREAPQQGVAAGQRREQRIESAGPGSARILRHEEALQEGGVHGGGGRDRSRCSVRGPSPCGRGQPLIVLLQAMPKVVRASPRASRGTRGRIEHPGVEVGGTTEGWWESSTRPIVRAC